MGKTQISGFILYAARGIFFQNCIQVKRGSAV